MESIIQPFRKEATLMKQFTLFQTLLPSIFSESEVKQVAQEHGYEDPARKFTVFQLLRYWTQAALEPWKGYRSGVDQASLSGLPSVHYSTFSGKAAEVPFTVFKTLFHQLLGRKGRAERRSLQLPQELLLIDSTTMTVGKTRLPWAPYHGERAGVKLHVALDLATSLPVQVQESVGSRHDSPVGEELADPNYTLVQDRAYGKIERFDRYLTEKQGFVIRLKENVKLVNPRSLRRFSSEASYVQRDLTCQLGTAKCRSEKRHRVVIFDDGHGHKIRVVTNLMAITAEEIAHMYKARWQIELFFRWIKQHLNVPTLFGTTENAVYGQLFSALIVYVLLKTLFAHASRGIPEPETLTFVRFVRLFMLNKLSARWRLLLLQLNMRSIFFNYQFTITG
jgi:hypothetical protein